MPQRTALLFAYDGAAFDGYARQADASLRTVEEALIGRLQDAGVFGVPRAARFRSGSRTDRGVSALANVVALDSDIPPARVAGAVGLKVAGLWPLASTAVDGSFDPRHAARREYRYFLGPWDLPAAAGVADLQAALAPFRGRHDFSAFARLEEGRDPVRSVDEVAVRAAHDLLEVRVVGRSFLWNQVRRMVSAALAVVRGEASVAHIERWLEHPHEAADLGLAPAAGLVLWDVAYPGLALPPQRPLAARAAVALGERLVAVAARAEAARELRRRLLG